MSYPDFQNRVKLLINYSLKKTLSENKSYLDEQSVVGAPNSGMMKDDFTPTAE